MHGKALPLALTAAASMLAVSPQAHAQALLSWLPSIIPFVMSHANANTDTSDGDGDGQAQDFVDLPPSILQAQLVADPALQANYDQQAEYAEYDGAPDQERDDQAGGYQAAGYQAQGYQGQDYQAPYAAAPSGPVSGPGYTTLCRFTEGPRTGDTVDFSATPGAQPVQIGSTCMDMQGNSGVAIAGGQQPEQPLPPQGRYYQSGPEAQAQVAQQALPPGFTLTCRFITGPRGGQTVDFSGTTGATPTRIGSGCADMVGSSGVAVAPLPPQPVTPPVQQAPGRYYYQQPPQAYQQQAQPTLTYTCRFTSGPRAGSSFDYSGTLGAAPMAVGSPCSDGLASQGVAVANWPWP